MSNTTMKRKIQSAIVLAASLASLSMSLPAQAASHNQLWSFNAAPVGRTIRSYLSRLCLRVPIRPTGMSIEHNGTIPFLGACGNLGGERDAISWDFVPTGDGFSYYIRRRSGKYLSIMTRTTANGGWVGLWDLYRGNDQKWYFRGGPSEYQLVNYNSGKCLSIANWNTTVGATLVQWTC